MNSSGLRGGRANPAANTFEGARRELLRVGHVVMNLTHPMGAVEFNPTAKPGTPDYGLLYTSGFVAATMLLHAAGVGVGLLASQDRTILGRRLVQSAGGAMTLFGVAVLAGLL